jgi:glycosyltransferase involved in cell wall biosynthesis
MFMKKIGIDARFCTAKATGIGRHVFELIKGIAEIDKNNEFHIFLNEEQYESFVCPGKNFYKHKTKSKHYSFSEQLGFWRQLESYKFDLMIFPHFNAPILYSRPFVVTIHDLTLHKFPGGKKRDIISKLAYRLLIHTVVRKAKHCFAVSENTKRDMMKYLKISSEKITVAYNGVSQRFSPIHDVDRLKKFRIKHQLPEKYILYTGVFRSHKNIERLIDAYAMCKKNHSEFQLSLVLAGPHDSASTDIPERIKRYGLEKDIFLTGFFPEEEMQELYSASTAYIFPSLYEGFGIPPIEAMQCEVPVACSNTSSLPEVCGDAVLYFDPYNTKEISEALFQISNDEKLRKDLVEKGKKQSQKFSWKDMVFKMYGVYKRLLNLIS